MVKGFLETIMNERSEEHLLSELKEDREKFFRNLDKFKYVRMKEKATYPFRKLSIVDFLLKENFNILLNEINNKWSVKETNDFFKTDFSKSFTKEFLLKSLKVNVNSNYNVKYNIGSNKVVFSKVAMLFSGSLLEMIKNSNDSDVVVFDMLKKLLALKEEEKEFSWKNYEDFIAKIILEPKIKNKIKLFNWLLRYTEISDKNLKMMEIVSFLLSPKQASDGQGMGLKKVHSNLVEENKTRPDVFFEAVNEMRKSNDWRLRLRITSSGGFKKDANSIDDLIVEKWIELNKAIVENGGREKSGDVNNGRNFKKEFGFLIELIEDIDFLSMKKEKLLKVLEVLLKTKFEQSDFSKVNFSKNSGIKSLFLRFKKINEITNNEFISLFEDRLIDFSLLRERNGTSLFYSFPEESVLNLLEKVKIKKEILKNKEAEESKEENIQGEKKNTKKALRF